MPKHDRRSVGLKLHRFKHTIELPQVRANAGHADIVWLDGLREEFNVDPSETQGRVIAERNECQP